MYSATPGTHVRKGVHVQLIILCRVLTTKSQRSFPLRKLGMHCKNPTSASMLLVFSDHYRHYFQIMSVSNRLTPLSSRNRIYKLFPSKVVHQIDSYILPNCNPRSSIPWPLHNTTYYYAAPTYYCTLRKSLTF